MVAYGKYLTYSRAVNYLGKNIDVVLIGRFFGAAPAGLYQKAEQWASLSFQQVYFPLVNVAVSSFSRLLIDPPRYRSHFRKALVVLFAVTLPLMAFAFVDARELILVLLGQKWTGAVPIFRALTVGAFAAAAGHITRWVYLAEGQVKRQFNWSLILTPSLVIGVIAGLPWGAAGVAWGYTAAVWATTYPGLRYCFARSLFQMSDFWSAAWRPILLSILAAAALFGFRRITTHNDRMIAQLVIDIAVFSVLYCGGWLATSDSRREVSDCFSLLRHLRLSKRDDPPSEDVT
jgi:PST family polysaccharide transporter